MSQQDIRSYDELSIVNLLLQSGWKPPKEESIHSITEQDSNRCVMVTGRTIYGIRRTFNEMLIEVTVLPFC